MKKILKVENLDCANCAAKMEYAITKLDGVNKASVNFLTQKIVLDINEDKALEIIKLVIEVAKKTIPDCEVYE